MKKVTTLGSSGCSQQSPSDSSPWSLLRTQEEAWRAQPIMLVFIMRIILMTIILMTMMHPHWLWSLLGRLGNDNSSGWTDHLDNFIDWCSDMRMIWSLFGLKLLKGRWWYDLVVPLSTNDEGHADHRVRQELHVIVLSRERIPLLQESFIQQSWIGNRMMPGRHCIFLLHILQSLWHLLWQV